MTVPGFLQLSQLSGSLPSIYLLVRSDDQISKTLTHILEHVSNNKDTHVNLCQQFLHMFLDVLESNS